MSFTANRAQKAKRENFQSGFRGRPEFCVATIDFGTVQCSLHWRLTYIGTEEPFTVPLDNDGRLRIPNCILFNKFGVFHCFGHDARRRYVNLDPRTRNEYIYFEHVKKEFQRNENVNRDTTVKADNGKTFYLLDVIAHILHYLKTTLMDSLKTHAQWRDKQPSDIDWVITVPAIWKAAGKQMMREAGYQAGLCSNSNPPKLKPTQESVHFKINDVNPDHLSLALEPESAAIKCLQEEVQRKPSQYLVVDIGGGTVDIACHKVSSEGHIEEVLGPVGNFWGGTTVNESFQRFFEELVNDPGLQRYIKDEEKGSNHQAHLRTFVYTHFEDAKIDFGKKSQTEGLVIMPLTLYNVYHSQLQDITRKDVKLEADDAYKLRLGNTVMKSFFQPAISGISELLISLLSGPAAGVDKIYWVGGFGSSNYLREALEANVRKAFRDRCCEFFSPHHPHLAVVQGASFRCDPNIIHKRRADATYGIGIKVPFDDRIHKVEHKWYAEDKGEYWCDNIFSIFVEKGEIINANEVFVTQIKNLRQNQDHMTLKIYSSPLSGNETWYTTQPFVKYLGEVTLQMEGVGLNRWVEIVFDITHTEIQVRAHQRQTRKEVKTVVDFLSAQK